MSGAVLPEHMMLQDSRQLEAAHMSPYSDYPIHSGTVVEEDQELIVWDAHRNLVLKQIKNSIKT